MICGIISGVKNNITTGGPIRPLEVANDGQGHYPSEANVLSHLDPMYDYLFWTLAEMCMVIVLHPLPHLLQCHHEEEEEGHHKRHTYKK
jgi:hypothetical protein